MSDIPQQDKEELRKLAQKCFIKGKGVRYRIQPLGASDEFLLKLAALYYSKRESDATDSRAHPILEKRNLQQLACALAPDSSPPNTYREVEISRLLEAADYRGLIRIVFVSPGSDSDVETQLKNKYGLKHVRVCLASPEKEAIYKNIGKHAAKLFDDIMVEKPDARVAIGGGQTIYAMVEETTQTYREITVSPLALFTRDETNIGHGEIKHAPFLALALTWRLKCRASVCAIPPLPTLGKQSLSFTSELFQRCPSLLKIFESACEADVVFTGASHLTERSYSEEVFTRAGLNRAELKKLGCIGHMNFSAFDAHGDDVTMKSSIRSKIRRPHASCHPFLAAVNIDSLRKSSADTNKYIVLVSGGQGKVNAIRANLNAKNVNCLVTDAVTAEALLKD